MTARNSARFETSSCLAFWNQMKLHYQYHNTLPTTQYTNCFQPAISNSYQCLSLTCRVSQRAYDGGLEEVPPVVEEDARQQAVERPLDVRTRLLRMTNNISKFWMIKRQCCYTKGIRWPIDLRVSYLAAGKNQTKWTVCSVLKLFLWLLLIRFVHLWPSYQHNRPTGLTQESEFSIIKESVCLRIVIINLIHNTSAYLSKHSLVSSTAFTIFLDQRRLVRYVVRTFLGDDQGMPNGMGDTCNGKCIIFPRIK